MFTDSLTKKASFYARNLKRTGSSSKPLTLVFPDVDFNIGGGYSSSTGIFTAPFPGVYSFMATLGAVGVKADQVLSYYLVVNGQVKLPFHHDFAKDNHDNVVPLTAVLKLAEGDTVSIRKDGATPFSNRAGNSLSGFLIHPY